jgi:N-acetylglutamate synthase
MDAADLELRAMTSADILPALALWGGCEGVGLSDSDDPEQVTAFLHRNPGLSWVAVRGEEVVGAVLAGHDGRRGFLYHLAVRADERRAGLGRSLVAHAIAGLREQGLLKCQIVVFSANTEGNQFWARLGWQRRDDLKVYSVFL